MTSEKAEVIPSENIYHFGITVSHSTDDTAMQRTARVGSDWEVKAECPG